MIVCYIILLVATVLAVNCCLQSYRYSAKAKYQGAEAYLELKNLMSPSIFSEWRDRELKRCGWWDRWIFLSIEKAASRLEGAREKK